MKKLLLLFMLASISTSVLSRDLTSEEQKAVEDVIKEDLKDPFSVVFYHGHKPDKPDSASGVYCGQYNAKNSYGAYSGKKLFAVYLLGDTVENWNYNDAGKLRSQDVISALCAQSGYDIPVDRAFFSDVNKKRVKSGFPKLDKTYRTG